MPVRLRDLVEVRVQQPPPVEDQRQSQWQRDIADALNALPNLSIFSFATPESNVTAAFGTMGINITESATLARLWVKDTGQGSTGWLTFTEASPGAGTFSGSTVRLAEAPAEGALGGKDPGTVGDIAWGSSSGVSFLYVCVSTDSWMRATLNPF